MSRTFKICLIVLGAYVLLMSPLLLQGAKDGSFDMRSLPVYIGLLVALLAGLKKRRN